MNVEITSDAPTKTAGNIGDSQLEAMFLNSGIEESQPNDIVEEPVVETEEQAESPEEQPVLSQEETDSTEASEEVEVEEGEVKGEEVSEESESETEDDSETPDESEVEEEPEEGNKEPAWLKKRIERFVRKQNELKEEVERLTEINEQLKTRTDAQEQTRVNMANTVEEIDQQLSLAQSAIETVASALVNRSDDFDADGNAVYEIEGQKFTEDQLVQIQKDALTVVQQAPGRKQLIVQREAADRAIEEAYPFLSDISHEDHELAQQVMNSQEYILLSQFSPNAKELAVRFVESERYRRQKAAKAKIKNTKAPSAKPAKQAQASGPVSSKPLSDAQKSARAKKRMLKKGSLDQDALTAYFLK